MECENNENKQKEAGVGLFKKSKEKDVQVYSEEDEKVFWCRRWSSVRKTLIEWESKMTKRAPAKID